MKKQFQILFIIISFSHPIYSQLKPLLFQFKKDTVIKWNFFFGDEFSSTDVNDEKWYRGYPWGGLSIAEDEYADPLNLKVKNGTLELYANRTNETRKFPDWMIDSNAMKKYGKKLVDGKYPLKFTGSAIWSKDQIKYGYFECRCRMQNGKGLWPAFWLYGGNPNDEIDLMELKGERSKEIHVDVHCPDNCDKGYPGLLGIKKNWGAWVKLTSMIFKQWNIISGVWLPGYVIFYLNGEPLAYFEGDFKNSMNLIANLAVAVDNGAFNPGPDKKTKFPAKMEVDYIRVWKTPEDSAFRQREIQSIENDEEIKTFSSENNLLPKYRHVKFFMRRKKQINNEIGFLSFYPISKKKYRITQNSSSRSSLQIVIRNNSKEILKEMNIDEMYYSLDLNEFTGSLFVEVEFLGKKSSFSLDI